MLLSVILTRTPASVWWSWFWMILRRNCSICLMFIVCCVVLLLSDCPLIIQCHAWTGNHCKRCSSCVSLYNWCSRSVDGQSRLARVACSIRHFNRLMRLSRELVGDGTIRTGLQEFMNKYLLLIMHRIKQAIGLVTVTPQLPCQPDWNTRGRSQHEQHQNIIKIKHVTIVVSMWLHVQIARLLPARWCKASDWSVDPVQPPECWPARWLRSSRRSLLLRFDCALLWT